MRKQAIVLAVALVMAPFGVSGADLEDQAVREIIAAFEQDTGKQVEIVLGPQEELVADLGPRSRPDAAPPISSSQSPRSYEYMVVSGDWRHSEGYNAWPEAVNRVVADNITPEHAVDEAIARVKQILSE